MAHAEDQHQWHQPAVGSQFVGAYSVGLRVAVLRVQVCVTRVLIFCPKPQCQEACTLGYATKCWLLYVMAHAEDQHQWHQPAVCSQFVGAYSVGLRAVVFTQQALATRLRIFCPKPHCPAACTLGYAT